MICVPSRPIAAGLLVVAALMACHGSANPPVSTAPAPSDRPLTAAEIAHGDSAGIAEAQRDSMRLPYTAADVAFMTGMIGHHSQAIVMAKWAPSHGASPSVQVLCARIINAQRDDIVLMQRWLRYRRQPVPMVDSSGVAMMPGQMMPGMTMGAHPMALMPGMLTAQQMAALDAARGPEFDRLFLTDMIQHHRGAVGMVHDLFETPGAGQDELIFKFASDVNVDQTTEIARMEKMLAILTLTGAGE